MHKGSLMAAAALLGFATAGAALAQGLDASEVNRDIIEFQEPQGYDVQVRAGVGGFLGGVGELTGVGPVWGVQVEVDPANIMGLELAYEGSRTPITDERVADGEAIWRNGLSGAAKLFAPGFETWRPFAGAGLGFAYLNPSDGAEDLYQNDFVAEIPVMLGIELNTPGGFTAGLRGTYRFTLGEEVADLAAAGSPGGGLLSAAATLGGRF
jgi:hypothetical protein